MKRAGQIGPPSSLHPSRTTHYTSNFYYTAYRNPIRPGRPIVGREVVVVPAGRASARGWREPTLPPVTRVPPVVGTLAVGYGMTIGPLTVPPRRPRRCR